MLGPSGCGKTTTLRMVAGLDEPTTGRVFIGDEDITNLRPYKRPVNTVFQSYALFPHLTIFDNVAFGPRRRGDNDYKQKTREMLELVAARAMAARKPAQLSGGQQQRVALGRALINEPGVLLLDEPLGALDLKLRRQMQIELKRIQTEIDITFVHVTHDQEEAMTMADTIAVMNHGVIEQMGAPGDLYENPQTTFVANFLGQSNLIAGDVLDTTADTSSSTCHGQKVAVAAARCHTRQGKGVARRTAGEDFRQPGRRESHDGSNVAPWRSHHRRQLRRGEHPVPRPDAVGPGADGVRAEHRTTSLAQQR